MSPVLHPLQVLSILMEMSDEDAGKLLAECGEMEDDEFCVRASAWLIKWQARRTGGAMG